VQEVLDTNNLQAENRTDARKEKLDADAVWELMESAEQIIVAKGKSVETFVPEKDDRDTILKAVLGRSGSLRAPTVKTGDVFFVGYNDALYADVPFVHG